MIGFTCSAPDKATVDMNGVSLRHEPNARYESGVGELVTRARASVRSLKNQLLTLLIALRFLDMIGKGERALFTRRLKLLNRNYCKTSNCLHVIDESSNDLRAMFLKYDCSLSSRIHHWWSSTALLGLIVGLGLVPSGPTNPT